MLVSGWTKPDLWTGSQQRDTHAQTRTNAHNVALTETDLNCDQSNSFPTPGSPEGRSSPFASMYIPHMCACLYKTSLVSPGSPQVWSLKVEQEVEKNRALAEALQTLATERQQLQQSLCRSGRSSTLGVLSEDDFFDAVSGQRRRTKHVVSVWGIAHFFATFVQT